MIGASAARGGLSATIGTDWVLGMARPRSIIAGWIWPERRCGGRSWRKPKTNSKEEWVYFVKLRAANRRWRLFYEQRKTRLAAVAVKWFSSDWNHLILLRVNCAHTNTRSRNKPTYFAGQNIQSFPIASILSKGWHICKLIMIYHAATTSFRSTKQKIRCEIAQSKNNKQKTRNLPVPPGLIPFLSM